MSDWAKDPGATEWVCEDAGTCEHSGGLPALNAGPPPRLARADAPAKNLVWRYEKLSMIYSRSYKLSFQLLEKQHNFIFGLEGHVRLHSKRYITLLPHDRPLLSGVWGV